MKLGDGSLLLCQECKSLAWYEDGELVAKSPDQFAPEEWDAIGITHEIRSNVLNATAERRTGS